MEKYFKVGQKVWDIQGSEGVVIETNDSTQYPLVIQFNKESDIRAYTHDGRCYGFTDITIFQTKPIITPNVPIV